MSYRVGESRFWDPLWKLYPNSPSVVLCRVPELEYASTLDVRRPVLDHGCGDGLFSSLAWPGCKLMAGCDLNDSSIREAEKRGNYKRLDVCDASRRLPYPDKTFDLIFNNSALEHIQDLDATLAEVARALSPQGTFAFSVLNRRFFSWCHLREDLKTAYKNWQPFFHVLDLDEWRQRLARVGLKVASVEGYLDQKAASELALLDFAFSGALLARRRSLLVSTYLCFSVLARAYWRKRLSSLLWKTQPDAGAGYFIRAEPNAV
jgi:SAM-dependent methyltransferase